MAAGEQLAQAQRVKRHTPGFVVSPAVLSPEATVAEYDDLRVRLTAVRGARVSPCLWSRAANRAAWQAGATSCSIIVY